MKLPLSRRSIWGISLACLAIAATVGYLVYTYHDMPRHFGVVKPGVLYRSSQPDYDGWEWLAEKYGIRTVVDLRRPEEDASWFQKQEKFCRHKGISIVNIPLAGDGSAPTPEQIRQFLQIVNDPARQPVMVHCEVGVARTGVMVAAYRMIVDGWTYEQALDEARLHRFPLNHTTEHYYEFLRQLQDQRQNYLAAEGSQELEVGSR